MSEEKRSFKMHAVLELLGHNTLAGLVTEETIAGSGFLRVDVPRPDGTTVTQFVGAKSVFRIRPCTEEVATEQARNLYGVEPVKPVDWGRQLPAAGDDMDDEETPF